MQNKAFAVISETDRRHAYQSEDSLSLGVRMPPRYNLDRAYVCLFLRRPSASGFLERSSFLHGFFLCLRAEML